MSIHNNKRYENEFVNMMVEKGHACFRIAGSGAGKDAVCDCVLLKDKKVYLVEVKATKEKIFYLRTHVKEQLARMNAVAKNHSIDSMLAVKLKKRGWRLYENEEMGI